MGRSFTLIYHKLTNKSQVPEYILSTKKEIIYPIIGYMFSGNLLIILNIFFPLKSAFVYAFLFLTVAFNFVNINIKIKDFLIFKNIFFYLVIPSILIISTYNVFFHYDAGFYHLNHQNWLRESNMILGFVNIFWAFGMSSIHEYVSSILWFENNFVSLHFLNLLFISFFYIFLSDNLISQKFKPLRNASLFIFIFSILDNFGFNGGRNGFIYIEGVAKQDIATAILFFYISLIGIFIISKEVKMTDFEIILFSLLALLTIQLKLNSVILFLLYLFVLYKQIKLRDSLRSILFTHLSVFFFASIWIVKTFLTTGCLIFPLSLTCINSFDWYEGGSSVVFESISKESSLNYQIGTSFALWLEKYLDYELYKGILLNFSLSLFFLILIKLIIFEKTKNSNYIYVFLFIYILSNLSYLLFFGPIPRYGIGIMMTIIGSLGLLSGEIKFQYKKIVAYTTIFLSVFFLVRADSYKSFLGNDSLILFDPRPVAKYVQFNENWVIPDEGDQCWVNLKCTMNMDDIQLIDKGLFKTAYKY